MKQKKFILKKDSSLGKNIVFCSECGEELELFGIEEIDIQKIKERHQRCRDIGKFNGDKCAMLFIAQSNEDLFIGDESSDEDL
jgi:hypothetical protein